MAPHFVGDRYLAGPDADRAADLERALRSPDVDAVIFARGGYGTMRLLERIDPGLLRDHPKWIVGYSDITALHLWAQHQGVASIHGPLVESLAKHPEHLKPLLSALSAASLPTFSGLRVRQPGQGTGRLIGGNLSLLAALMGTRWLPNLRGAILMVEEIAEPLYRIDRMVQSLRLDGRAEGLAGVVLGDFTRCGPSDADPAEVMDQIADLFTELGAPVVSGLPVGHGDANTPVVLGATYELDAHQGILRPARDTYAT